MNTVPDTEAPGDANGAIRIDDSREVLNERLELCLLRSASFEPGKTDPAWAEFLGRCLAALEALHAGNAPEGESAGPAEVFGNSTGDGMAEPEYAGLQEFWYRELSVLPEDMLVPAWETTLQILLEAECAKAENVPVSEKEIRNILYFYFYDYAEEILAAASKESFLTAFLAGSDSGHVQTGLSLFFGDRLKARLLDILERQQTGGGSSARKRGAVSVFPVRGLTSHQQKALEEFRKKAASILTMVLLVLSLAACTGGQKEKQAETAVMSQEDGEAYPGTVAYQNGEQEIDDKFGIMHATVLDVQNGEKDGLFIYTIRDREDPDNAWCLNSQDVGSIVCDVTGGREVAVLFSGDIVNDPDHLEFIAILDDAPLTIRQAEGTTVSNMMNSFTIRTTKGVEMSFIKDNCKVDRDALSTEPGSRILIYYTEGGTTDHYPLRVYKLPQKDR